MATHDFYRRFSEEVLAALERGDHPWRQAAPDAGRPLKHTGEPFGGAGVLAQWSTAKEKGFRLPTWMTFSAVREHGGRLLGGADPVTVFHGYTRPAVTVSAGTGEGVVRTIETWRPYTVFNVEQVEGLPRHLYRSYQEIRPVSHHSPDQELDDFVQTLGADIRLEEGTGSASSIARALVQWTGHPARMNRRVEDETVDGGKSRAREELVVEIGTAFLSADLGVPMHHGGGAGEVMVEAWRGLLKDDEMAIFRACRDASRAVDRLHHSAPGFRIEPGMSKSGVVLSDTGQSTAASGRGLASAAPRLGGGQAVDTDLLVAARDARHFAGEAWAFPTTASDGADNAAAREDARRLLDAAARIDLTTPGVKAAIEATLAVAGAGRGAACDAAAFLSRLRGELQRRLDPHVEAEGQRAGMEVAARSGGVRM